MSYADLKMKIDEPVSKHSLFKGTMSTTMHCALKQCLAAILLAE